MLYQSNDLSLSFAQLVGLINRSDLLGEGVPETWAYEIEVDDEGLAPKAKANLR